MCVGDKVERSARNSSVVFALIVAVLLLAGCAFFGPGEAPGATLQDAIFYGANQTANVSLNNKTVAVVKLLNGLENRSGAMTFTTGMDLFSADVDWEITPLYNFTLNSSFKLEGKLSKSKYGTSKLKGIFIWQNEKTNFTEPTYAVFLRNFTSIDNSTGQNTTIFYNSTEQNGTQTIERDTSHFVPFKASGFKLKAGQTYKLRLSYERARMDDATDLFPSFAGLDFTGWAWWNTTWKYKVQVNATNWYCEAAYCQFAIPITLNSSATNGSDIRVLDSTESVSLGFNRHDDWNYTTASGNLGVNASNQSTQFYVYYGATGVSDNSAVNGNYLKISDDFSGTSFNTTKWGTASAGSYLVGGGLLNMSAASVANAIFGQAGVSGTYTYLRWRQSGGETYIDWNQLAGSLGSVRCSMQTSPNLYVYTNASNSGTATTGATNTWFKCGVNIPLSGNANVTIYNDTGVISAPTLSKVGPPEGTSRNFSMLQFSSGLGQVDFVLVSPSHLAEPTFTISSQMDIIPLTVAIYGSTAIASYNGTHINYTFTAIALNTGTANLSNINVSITANGTLRGSAVVTLNTSQFYTLTANWAVLRPATDLNFTFVAAATDTFTQSNSSSYFMILPIDPVDAVILKGGSADTNVSIWNGSAWVPFTSSSIVNFRCSNPFPSYCQPQNQNNASGQAIFRVKNNGTKTSTYQAVMTNTTWGANANLSCSNLTSPVGSVKILDTGFQNCTTANLTTGQYMDEYLYFYIVAVPSGFPRDFNLTWRVG